MADEGMVREVKDGKYCHEVYLKIGEAPHMSWTRAEIVFAFSESNVKEE